MINTQRLIDNFCEFVKVPSESPNDQEFITYIEKFFSQMEGSTSQKDSYGNLIVKFPAKNSLGKNTVGFCCHGDTVKPGIGIKPTVDKEKGTIKSDGTTILGADDKAGIAEIVEMLYSAKKYPPLEVIITRCEELGGIGAMNLDYSLVASKMVYILDAEGIGDAIVGAPTYITFDVSYKGIPAHAGMAPEKGVSSILAATKAISKLRLGKLDHETTANVGTIQGGEVRNGVPEHTKLMAECRSVDHEKAMKLADEMEKIFRQSAKEVGAEVTVDRKLIAKGYHLTENSEAVKRIKDAYIKNDVNLRMVTIMGGSDANHFNSHNIPTITISAGYTGEHSCTETLSIKEAEIMTKTIISLVEDLA